MNFDGLFEIQFYDFKYYFGRALSGRALRYKRSSLNSY
jgi:hypothetical protein